MVDWLLPSAPLLLVGLVLAICQRAGSARTALAPRAPVPDESRAAAALLRVPRMHGAVDLDGDADDPGWTASPGPARTGPFRSDYGGAAVPYSEARLVRGDGYLYVALYAADDDILSVANEPYRQADSFRMTFEGSSMRFVIEVSPDGHVTEGAAGVDGGIDPAWNSGAFVSREIDGSVDDSTDTDEEWLVEMAIPLSSLGLKGERGERMGFSVRRCDARRGSAPACAGWGAPNLSRGGLLFE